MPGLSGWEEGRTGYDVQRNSDAAVAHALRDWTWSRYQNGKGGLSVLSDHRSFHDPAHVHNCKGSVFPSLDTFCGNTRRNSSRQMVRMLRRAVSRIAKLVINERVKSYVSGHGNFTYDVHQILAQDLIRRELIEMK